MATPLQNPFNPQPLASPVSYETLEVDQYISPSGQTVEIQTGSETGEDPSGKSYTKKFYRTVPPLADGIVPESVKDIRECSRCTSLIHVTSSCICQGCNFTFCCICAHEVKVGDNTIWLCVSCMERSDPSLLKAVKKTIWGK